MHIALVLALSALGAAQRPVPQAPKPAQDPFEPRAARFLATYCAECHSGESPEGEFSIESAARAPIDALDDWREIRRELHARRMPPRKALRPPDDERAALLSELEQFLARHAPPIDPGTVTLRRLNRNEYRNSVRDLCGVEFDAQGHLPPDEVGYGFDSIADVLSMPDILFERYVDAAQAICERAILVHDPANPPTRRFADAELLHTEKFMPRNGSWSLYSNGFVGAQFEVPRRATYVLRALAWAQQAGTEPARMEFRLDGRVVADHDVLAEKGAPGAYETRVTLEPGERRFEAWFVNDFYLPDEPDKSRRDRNLYVEQLELIGPLDVPLATEFQRRLLAGDRPARDVIAELARRAWRRPVSSDEVDALLALSAESVSREERVRAALEALLCSPHFLFRVEQDPPDAAPGSVRALNGFELATRLSYLVWSSAPDDALLAAAESGALLDEAGRARELSRLLRDPRASELTRNFASQWLQLRQLEHVTPDAERFADFDDALRESMRAETELLFESVLREQRPLRDLIDPDFTFLDERLARHYGLDGVRGARHERVRLDSAQRAVRGGLLQQASVLTVTSNPTRTSPVKRGKWVLETLLGSPPLAPQPGVDSLDESSEAARAASLRERLALHRADPSCAVCHDRMDNLGFALEHYDPIGRWREHDGGFPIDASGEFEDGQTFVGAELLERRLARDPAFARCVLEKLSVYALGRGLGPADQAALDAAQARLGADPTLVDALRAVVELDAFRMRTVPAR